MAKIVKITQSDIENIVTNIVNEQSEIGQPDSIAHEETEVTEQGEMSDEKPLNIAIGKGEDGYLYALNADTGQVLTRKKV